MNFTVTGAVSRLPVSTGSVLVINDLRPMKAIFVIAIEFLKTSLCLFYSDFQEEAI